MFVMTLLCKVTGLKQCSNRYGSHTNRVRHLILSGVSQNKMMSYPLSVSDAAVVAVVSLEVGVSSVPPGVHITLRPGVSQKAVCPL